MILKEHLMSEKLTWDDAAKIGVLLARKHPELYPPATVGLCRAWLPANLRHAGARLVWSGEAKRGRDLLRESARLELSVKTILALGAAAFPPRLGCEFMKARYFISRRFGI